MTASELSEPPLSPRSNSSEADAPRVRRDETIQEIRGEHVFRWLNKGWDYVDRVVQSALPPTLNPFGQLGAIANICLIIAVISGVALLIWYTPSVHKAHSSLEAIRTSSWLGQLVRSIHRYSSDGCLFFILLHACRITCQRRITGPRWLAWTTGLLLLALISFIGWTGYWLVWDVRAQHAALGTSRFLDSLPIFAEPLSRSFLTDETVPSVLFFVIFFIHMLAPLAVGIGIWMHLMRVNRARFIPNRPIIIAVAVSLVALSMIAPAISETPARMTSNAAVFTIDWWFLWPFALTDRLTGGALWAIFFFLGSATLSAPWWLAKRGKFATPKAEVELPRCIGCSLCAKDCPFNAITMVPRDDGRKFEVQSQVNPDLCVGCGICTGACDSQAINLPVLKSREIEREILAWIRSQQERGDKAFVAFACSEAAGKSLRKSGSYHVQTIPCAGWVSALMMERILQGGAAGVLVVGCGVADPKYREGGRWFADRLAGTREPKVDSRKADLNRVRFVRIGPSREAELVRIAAEFRNSKVSPPRVASARPRQFAMAAIVAFVIGTTVLIGSNFHYNTGRSPAPELVVSFNHSGALVEPRKLTKEELAKRLPHMRAQASVTRQRSPVRLRVTIDGNRSFDQAFAPKGISKDGPSIGLVRHILTPGEHDVTVEIADGSNGDQFTQTWSGKSDFKTTETRVILFDTKRGFTIR